VSIFFRFSCLDFSHAEEAAQRIKAWHYFKV